MYYEDPDWVLAELVEFKCTKLNVMDLKIIRTAGDVEMLQQLLKHLLLDSIGDFYLTLQCVNAWMASYRREGVCDSLEDEEYELRCLAMKRVEDKEVSDRYAVLQTTIAEMRNKAILQLLCEDQEAERSPKRARLLAQRAPRRNVKMLILVPEEFTEDKQKEEMMNMLEMGPEQYSRYGETSEDVPEKLQAFPKQLHHDHHSRLKEEEYLDITICTKGAEVEECLRQTIPDAIIVLSELDLGPKVQSQIEEYLLKHPKLQPASVIYYKGSYEDQQIREPIWGALSVLDCQARLFGVLRQESKKDIPQWREEKLKPLMGVSQANEAKQERWAQQQARDWEDQEKQEHIVWLDEQLMRWREE